MANCAVFKATFRENATFCAKFGEFHEVRPDPYTGPTEVTPTQETQTLYTEGTSMPSNIVVNPIPSNYGLITYNGSIITVS